MADPQLDLHHEQFESFVVRAISSDPSIAGDNDMMDVDVDVDPDVFRIAIDFGTTFSSVAYARTPASQQITTLRDVSCVARYPGDRPLPMNTQSWEPRQDVPTELWYPTTGSTGPGRHDGVSLEQDEMQSDDETISDPESSRSSSVSLFEIDRPTEEALTLPVKVRNKGFETTAWGFEVQNPLSTESGDRDGGIKISRFKLMLDKPKDESDKAVKTQSDTVTKLAKLKRSKLIQSNTDVITHFLEKLFIHIQIHLQQTKELKLTDKVEFILCVPAVWPSRACRVMQDSMAKAVQRSGLGQLTHGNLENLFIVSEPEAAASCILAEGFDDIYYGETIVILDAGGGTVDAITYRVTSSDPLRLSAEVIEPKTKLCGASYINEEYERFLFEKLKNETYLEKNGKTIKSIIAQKVVEFENVWKRIWNLEDKTYRPESIYIDDLQQSSVDRQLTQNHLIIEYKDVKRIFKRSIEGTVEVLSNQLEMAKAKGETVARVILTGGFGQSPYLRSKLRRFLKKQLNLAKTDIPLLVSKAGSTAVARGAILRASNKELGPVRMSSCSYGFLSSEPYDPDNNAAHKATKPRTDRVDGEKYVHNTINWLFKKGEELAVGMQKPFLRRHTFATTRRRLICEEVLYVSDDKKESSYRTTHPMNKGAEIAGSILVDMTPLRDQGLIPQESVSQQSAFFGKNKKVWVVEFNLLVRIDGRNLVYEAYWPKDSEDKDAIKASGQTCIAATFKPGTA